MKKITSITSMKMVKSERGIISIFTATLLILVLSLVVLGLAQLSRREQRASLDTQLSTQAFYAAESGINDAIVAIKDKMASGSVLAKTQCGDDTNYSVALPATKAKLNTDGTVRYSCLLIDPTPGVLKSTLSTSPSVLALTPAHPSFLNQIKLEWDPLPGVGNFNTDCPNNVSGNGDFAKKDDWNCGYGVVRVDLVPAGTLSRSAFESNTVTAFLVPTRSGSGSVTYASLKTDAGNGRVVGASCTATVCTATVDVGSGDYYMRATSVYLSGFELRVSSNSAAGNFVNSQVVVDSTGQAQDVLRRIAVNINIIGDQPSLASAALMSGDSVCKRFSVYDGFYASPSSINGGGGNPLCDVVAGTPPAPPSICSEPHDIVLVLDESSSMNSQWETVTRQVELKQVVNTYISRTASADGNHIGVVMFSNKSQTKKLLDLSSDVSLIKSTVNGMPWNGGTYFSRGLTIARDMLTGSFARTSVPKIIIFISDGRPDATIGDDPSDETEASILALTRSLKTNNGIAIYAIGIQQDGDPDAQSLLTSMSSGGSKYYTNAKYESDFSNFLADIQDDVSCPTP